MKHRKERYYIAKNGTKSKLDPTKVLLFLIGLLILSILACLVVNVGNARKNYYTQKAELASLHDKQHNLKAVGDKITEGKFNLVANEQELEKNYQELIQTAYGNCHSIKDLQNLKPQIIKYLGQSGYQQVHEQIVTTSAGKQVLIPSNNEEVHVGFSNYDSSNNTIDVTVCSIYNAKSYGVQGNNDKTTKTIIYINTVYNFATKSANQTSIQTASLGTNK